MTIQLTTTRKERGEAIAKANQILRFDDCRCESNHKAMNPHTTSIKKQAHGYATALTTSIDT